MSDESTVPTRHWHRLDEARVQCDICPRACKLRDGQRGMCFVRACEGGKIVLTTYGRSSGFCVDPVEKKPLNHVLPGTPILSFGTAGCNLACKFCQNWDISKSREIDTLSDAASPERIAQAAIELGCRSVAFTYNDPVIFHEYAIDVADACRAVGLASVAVTAGYDVPVHFTGFHPDWKLLDRPHTPASTLKRARRIAIDNGIRYAYTGNVHDVTGGTTMCHACGAPLIERDWYTMIGWHLTSDARCPGCGTRCAGVFDGPPGRWGAKRRAVRMLTDCSLSLQ